MLGIHLFYEKWLKTFALIVSSAQVEFNVFIRLSCDVSEKFLTSSRFQKTKSVAAWETTKSVFVILELIWSYFWLL